MTMNGFEVDCARQCLRNLLDLDARTTHGCLAIGRHSWRSFRTLDTLSGSSNFPVALKQAISHGLLVGRKTNDRIALYCRSSLRDALVVKVGVPCSLMAKAISYIICMRMFQTCSFATLKSKVHVLFSSESFPLDDADPSAYSPFGMDGRRMMQWLNCWLSRSCALCRVRKAQAGYMTVGQ